MRLWTRTQSNQNKPLTKAKTRKTTNKSEVVGRLYDLGLHSTKKSFKSHEGVVCNVMKTPDMTVTIILKVASTEETNPGRWSNHLKGKLLVPT